MKFKIVLMGILAILTLSLLLVSCSGIAGSSDNGNDNSNGNTANTGEIGSAEALAKCLTDSGAELYGAYWCPHCQQQKDLFGDAVEYVPYIECTTEQEKCSNAGIRAYPTWKFADGSEAVGGQSLENLASLSGCTY